MLKRLKNANDCAFGVTQLFHWANIEMIHQVVFILHIVRVAGWMERRSISSATRRTRRIMAELSVIGIID